VEASRVVTAEVAPSEGAVTAAQARAAAPSPWSGWIDAGATCGFATGGPGPVSSARLGGRTKLQDYFVNRKVARQRRDCVPIVVDETDRIVWVAGHAIDEDFRVTDPAQAVLVLRLKLLGGTA
jgi:hypothetical protein